MKPFDPNFKDPPKHDDLVKSFNPEEVDEILLALIACDNDDQKARDALVELGWPDNSIYPATIRQLAKREHPQRYQQLLKESTIDGTAEAAALGAKATALGIRRLLGQIEDGTVRDLPKAVDSVSQAMARSVEKNAVLQGQPERIVQHQSLVEVVRGLNSIPGVDVTLPSIEGAAEEITDE